MASSIDVLDFKLPSRHANGRLIHMAGRIPLKVAEKNKQKGIWPDVYAAVVTFHYDGNLPKYRA